MQRSKLELYEDIICALAFQAQTADSLAFECSTDCTLLIQRMEFLVQNDIVSIEVSRDNRAFYVLTRRGVAVARTFRITKHLEKLRTSDASIGITMISFLPDEERATRAR
jgi:predicted transcriptional regulator